MFHSQVNRMYLYCDNGTEGKEIDYDRGDISKAKKFHFSTCFNFQMIACSI